MTHENQIAQPSSDILTLTGETREKLTEIATSGTPVEQCLAIAAIGTWNLSGARDALLQAARNDDPDVRADALRTLVTLGEKGLGEAFLWSLQNDPTGDSKIAALRGFSDDDRELAAPILRKLVRDRCDDDVMWEYEGTDWDDWLDIQKEAIVTIGRLGIEEAVGDLLNAANDEFGQELWNEVLEALAGLGRPGLLALIDAGQSSSARQRARAARALGSSRDKMAVKSLDALSRDTSADVRLAALETLLERNAPLPDTRLMTDGSPLIRTFAATKSPTISTDDLIELAITDDDETVKIAAIRRLAERDPREVHARKLISHAKMKLRSEPEAFIAALAAILGTQGTDEAFELLLEINSHNRTPEIQRAVLGALVNYSRPETLDMLIDGISGNSQMVRLTALATLAALCDGEGEVADNAAAMLLLAARGDLVSEEEASGAQQDSETPQTAETQFGSQARDDDDTSGNRVVIDREGNIIQQKETDNSVKLSDYRKPDGRIAGEEGGSGNDPDETAPDETATAHRDDVSTEQSADIVDFPKNTLAAILQSDVDQTAFEEEKIDLSQEDLKFLELARSTVQKKRIRPDVAPNTAIDIQRIAVRLIGEQRKPVFTHTLLTCCSASDDELRSSALDSLLRRSERGIALTGQDWEKLARMPPDIHPPARMIHLELMAFAPDSIAVSRLENAMEQGDRSDRIAALKAYARKGAMPKQLGQMLASSDRLTRHAALEFACRFEGAGCTEDLIQAAFLESGALGSELAKGISGRGACNLSNGVFEQLTHACGASGVERIIALQILSELGQIAAIA